MKLAFALFKYFPYGGLQRDCIKIAQECVARGHKVDIFAMEASGEVPEPLTVTCLGVKSWVNYRRYEEFAKLLQQRIQKEGYDAVVGFNRMEGLDYYFGADPCFSIKLEGKAPWHRFLPRSRSFLRAEKAVYGKHSNTHIMLLTPAETPAIQDIYHTPNNRLHQLPPAVAPQFFAPPDYAERRKMFRDKLGLSEEQNLLLMVGSGFKIKGVGRVLKAVSHLPESVRAKTQLMILGKDHQGPFERLAKKLRIDDRVHFLGGRDDAADFMFAADLLLHPAHRESAGMVLVEAIAANLPVLVSDTCGYTFHIRESGMGIVHASPFDAQRFSADIVRALDVPPSYWQQCAQKYLAHTDLSGLANKAADIIEENSPS